MTEQAPAFQTDPRAEALGRVKVHLRETVFAETGLIAAIGQPQIASAVNRAILAGVGVLLTSAPTGALEDLADHLDAEAAALQQRQAEVNAAHPEDGTVLPEAQTSVSEDAPTTEPSADLTLAEGDPSQAPESGSEEPSEADQQSPGSTDTSEGSTPPDDPSSNA